MLKGLSVIIPARNEARNIGRLLSSIRSGGRLPLEMIVVDDGSEDDTAAIARDSGATIVEPGTPPAGWRGKTWACQQGGQAARGRWLLFLDADTWILPNGLVLMAGEAGSRHLDALSLAPYHETARGYEQFSAIFNLTTCMGVGAFAVWDSRENPGGLFGPCLLIDREVYRKVGGHERVKGEILEHLSLAPVLSAAGARLASLSGRGVIHTRMYPDGWYSLIEGWTKAFAAGAAKTSGFRLFLVVIWIFGSLLPLLGLALIPWMGWHLGMWGLAYPAFVIQWWVFLRRIGRFSIWTPIFYPVMLFFFFGVFGRSFLLRIFGRQVVWKGRSISSL